MIAILNRAIGIMFITFGLSHAKAQRNVCEDHQTLNLRGYNMWEELQSDVCFNISRNPLDSNSLITNLKLQIVEVEIAYPTSSKFIIDRYHYSKVGNLELTETDFYNNTQHKLRVPGLQIRYEYDSISCLPISREYIQLAIVDQNIIVDCLHSKKVTTIRNGSLLLNEIIYESEDIEGNCRDVYQISEIGLINRIEHYTNDTLIFTHYFTYSFEL